MEANDKKLAAAVAAVAAYLQTEQEALYLAASGVDLAPKKARRPAGAANLWGLSGRQAMMQNRTLMQLKAFGR